MYVADRTTKLSVTIVSLLVASAACSDDSAGGDDTDGTGGKSSSTSGAAGERATQAGQGGQRAVSGAGGQAAGPSSSGAAGERATQAGQGGQRAMSGAGGQAAGQPSSTPRTCPLPAPAACPDPAPTYADVAPVFEQRCVVCHAGMPNGPWPLNTYGHVATWRDTVRAALLQCTMPPPDSGLTIDDSESTLVLNWIRCGMPM